MTSKNRVRRLPRSIRKHLRQQKALLRRTLPAAEARRAIEQLERRLGAGTALAAAPDSAPAARS
jgi:hypothetical protein